MNNQIIVGLLLTAPFFLFCTLNALMFKFYVANEFVSGNDIYMKLAANAEIDHDHKDGVATFGETLTWSFSTPKYSRGIICKCWVDELVEDSSTSYGYFEAVDHELIKAYHEDDYLPDNNETFTLKWIVNEVGAAFLSWKNGNYEMIIPWPIKNFIFYVINDFINQEEIKLTITKGEIRYKEEPLISGGFLHWTHRYYVRSPENRVIYRCKVAEVAKLKTEEDMILGTFEVFNLKWIRRKGSKIETLEYRWRVTKQGAEKMDPKTGKYVLLHIWSDTNEASNDIVN